MIKIIHYYLGIVDGVFTNLVDLYRNLSNFKSNIEFRIIIPSWFPIQIKDIKFHSLDSGITNNLDFMENNKNFGDYDLFNCFTDKLIHSSDIIITSMRTFYEISQGVPLNISGDRFIILDTLDSTRIKLGQFDNLDKFIICNDVYFLSNPSNFGITRFKEIEYYHKLNEIRFNYMPWIQDSLYYCRKNRKKAFIKENCYAENIAKIIFEHLFMEKVVTYDPNGMFMKDGLSYYLNLFDINENIKQEVNISNAKLFEKLFFHKEDKLLTLL